MSTLRPTMCDEPGAPISKLLRGITDREAWGVHPIDDYVRAFEGSAWRATARDFDGRVIGSTSRI
jgi:hypothetical protein